MFLLQSFYLAMLAGLIGKNVFATNSSITQSNATSENVLKSLNDTFNSKTLRNASFDNVLTKDNRTDKMEIQINGTLKQTTSAALPTRTSPSTTTNINSRKLNITSPKESEVQRKQPKTKITILLSHFNQPNDHKGGLAAANVAIKQINTNPEILKDYELTVTPVYYLRTAGDFFRKFLFHINRPNPMLMIGPPNSAIIKDGYAIFQQTSLLQVNVNAFSDDLASTRKYPFLYSACQYENIFQSSLLTLLKQLEWTKIGMFYIEHTNFAYSETAEKFGRYAESRGIEFLDVQSIARIDSISGINDLGHKAIENSLQSFQKNDVRVIVLVADQSTLQNFLCKAYQMGMYGRKYAYIIFFGESYNDWIDRLHPSFPCKKEELYEINKNIIFQTRLAKAEDNVVTVSSKTVGETWRLIEEEVKSIKGRLLRFRDRLFYIYDSVWAFSLALDRVLKATPEYVDNYSWKTINDTRKSILADEFGKSSFQGGSGEFKFVEDGDKRYRFGDVVSYKVLNRGKSGKGKYMEIGTIDSKNINLDMSVFSYPVPLDGPKEIMHTKTYPLVAIALLWAFSVFGIALSLAFLVMNIYYGNVKFMKLSSPNINSLICIGCVFFFISVISYGLDSKMISKKNIPPMCNVTVLFFCIGFTLTFGSLFSKTWRIYRIFTRSQSLRYVVIKDIHLFSIVLLLVFLDAVIFVVWIGVAPFDLHQQVIKTVENKTLDTVEISVVDRCSCQYQTHFIATIFVYKGVLMLFGLFVAYETRTIKVEAINDSKNIGIAVYNFSVIFSLSAIVSYFLYDTDRYLESYVVFAVGIFESALVTLSLVFIPKIIMLSKNYDDPNFRNGRPVLDPNLRSHSESKSDANHSSTDGYGKKWTRSETFSSDAPKDSIVTTISNDKTSLRNGDDKSILKNSPNNNTNVKGNVFVN